MRHRNRQANPEPVLKTMAPSREDSVVAVECRFTWYWLADLCAQQGIAFVLGHALYMKAIHRGTAKNDTMDSQKIAVLRRGGMLPQAYVYPATSSSAASIWHVNAPHSSRPSRIPTASTIGLHSGSRWPTTRTERAWRNGALSPRCTRVSQSTSP